MAILGAIAILGVLLLPAPASAATLWLDAHDPGRDPFAGPVRTKGKLANNVPYVVGVRGTVSIYSPTWTRAPGRCGKPLKGPRYPSPGIVSGPVGVDAVFVFSQKRVPCKANLGVPYTWTGLQMASLRNYFELDNLLTPVTVPRRDHTYRFAVLGYGHRLRVRMKDPNTMDNYGRLRIVISRAKPRDCRNSQFQRWAYPGEAECVAATGGPPVPPPVP